MADDTTTSGVRAVLVSAATAPKCSVLYRRDFPLSRYFAEYAVVGHMFGSARYVGPSSHGDLSIGMDHWEQKVYESNLI